MSKLIPSVLRETPGAVFRLYMAVVLFLFALLSFCAVDLRVDPTTLDGLHDLVLSSPFWWGQFSLFGAASLIFRSRIAGWKLGAFLGDVSSVCMFSFLSYEYLTSKPPIYAGGIMAITAVLFLIGGLIDERRGA